MTVVYKEKRNLVLSAYSGSVSNTFKTAYNAVAATPEDGIENYSMIAGLGPMTLTFSGVRKFYGKNTDGSWTVNDLSSSTSVQVRGSWVDFYITGGAVSVDCFKSSGANPPKWNSRNQTESQYLPEPIKGSGEL